MPKTQKTEMTNRELLEAMAREAATLAELDAAMAPMLEKLRPLQARAGVHRARFDELNQRYIGRCAETVVEVL